MGINLADHPIFQKYITAKENQECYTCFQRMAEFLQNLHSQGPTHTSIFRDLVPAELKRKRSASKAGQIQVPVPASKRKRSASKAGSQIQVQATECMAPGRCRSNTQPADFPELRR